MVALPTSTEQVSAIVKLCNEALVPVIPFGTGTGLEGGVNAVSVSSCLVVDLVIRMFVSRFA